jgi:YD repeat-containing protein
MGADVSGADEPLAELLAESVRPLDRTPLMSAPRAPDRRDLAAFLPFALTPFLPPGFAPPSAGRRPGSAVTGGPEGGLAASTAASWIGPSAGDSVDLAAGVYRHRPTDDLVVRDPLGGPPAFFARAYSSAIAARGYQSPGLAVGWTHPYDVSVKPATDLPAAHPWQSLTLVWPGAAPASSGEEALAPVLDASGQPTGAFSHMPGTPYTTTGAPDLSPAAPKGQWQWLRLAFTTSYGRLVLTFTPAPADASRTYRYHLARVARMIGAREVGFRLVYGTPANPTGPLSALVNDAGVPLLTFENDPQYGFLKRVRDRFGRSVLYQFGAAAGTAELLAVSPVLLPSQLPADGSIPPFPSVPPLGSLWPRYQYGYERIDSQPRLSQVTVPDPSGGADPTSSLPRRYASARIAYDPAAGFVTARTDANGYTRAYTYQPAQGSTPGTPGYIPPLCTVTVTDRAGNLSHRFAEQIADGCKAGGLVDAFGQANTILYGDGANLYRPTQLISAQGHVTTLAWDGFGQLTALALPRTEMVPAKSGQPAVARHPALSLTYDPATGLLTSLAWTGPSGEPGPTLGLLYGPPASPTDPSAPSDPEAGMLTTLLGPDARRLPARGGEEAPVTTTLHHTPLGDLAALSLPAPREPAPQATALPTVTTTLTYTTAPEGDPLDGYTRTAEVFGEPIARTDPLGRLTRWRWDARGNLTAVIDPAGSRTDFIYDGWDRLTRILHPPTSESGPGRGWTQFDYTLPGYPDSPLAQVSEFDASGRLVARQASYLLGSEGELKTLVTPGLRADLQLDGAYRPVLRRDASGRQTAWVWDVAGLLREARLLSPTGAVQERALWPPAQEGSEGLAGDAYDADGQWLRRVDGVAADGSGGSTTTLVRAPDDGRVLARTVTGPEGKVAEQVAFAWDAFGHLTDVADGVGQYGFLWDTRTGHLLRSETAYYRRDNSLTEPVAIVYGYYPDGRLEEVMTSSQLGGPVLRFGYTYDAAGRLISCGPALAGTRHAFGNTEYAYSPADRLLTKTIWVNRVLQEITTSYRSDARGRLVGMTVTATDFWGNEKMLARLAVTPDALGDPVRIVGQVLDPVSGQAALAAATRAQDKATGQLRYIPYTATFGYDAGGRLKGDASDFAPAAAFGGTVFTRLVPDDAGNWTSYGSFPDLAYDGAHRLVGNGFGYAGSSGALGTPSLWRSVPLTLDALGRLTGIGTGGGAAGLRAGPQATGTIDAASAFPLPSAPVTFAYRFDGLCAWEEDASGQRTAYAYEGNLPLVAFQPREAADGGVPGSTYAVTALWGWGVDGLAFERWEHSRATGGVPYAPNIEQDSEHVLPVFDPLGFALFRLDERGLVFADGRLSGGGAHKGVWYRPGGIDFARGYTASTDPASGWRGQWGYFTDAVTGLERIGGRWYDPALGRYLTREPAYLLDPSPSGVLARGLVSPYAVDGGILNRTLLDWVDPYVPFAVRGGDGRLPGLSSFSGF